jgi:hypothetical protein
MKYIKKYLLKLKNYEKILDIFLNESKYFLSLKRYEIITLFSSLKEIFSNKICIKKRNSAV